VTNTPAKRPFVFLDRDGTLVHDAGYTHRVDDYRLLEGVKPGLKRLVAAGYALAIVTNQSGIGRGYYGEADYMRFQRHLEADLLSAGIPIAVSLHCPHLPDAGCGCRKPAPGMLDRAQREFGADLAASFVIGDAASDLALATRAGLRGAVLVLTGLGEETSRETSPSVPRAADLVAAARLIEGLSASDPRLPRTRVRR
jgi:D-glycero-D-manno-heptose 1,7-bisphosphate phosphatase